MAYSYAAYTGNGTTTNFNVPFSYLSKSHVTASVNGNPVAATWLNSSTLVISPAPAAGARVVIRRRTPVNQPAVVWEDGAVLSDDDLNLNTTQLLYIAQESADQTSTVSAELREFDDISSAFNGSLKTFYLSVNGDPVTWGEDGILAVALNGLQQIEGDAFTIDREASEITFAEAPEAGDTFYGQYVRFLPAVMPPEWNGGGDPGGGVDPTPSGSSPVIRSSDFDLVGDGVADDTAAFMEFVNACITQRLPGILEDGYYRVNNAVINDRVEIYGTTGIEAYEASGGAWIIHDNPAAPAITFTGTNARGSRLRNVSFKQAHPAVTSPNTPNSWAPTVYPPVIKVKDCYGGVELKDLFMNGVYLGVEMDNSGRTEIDGLFGQFFKGVLVMDKQYDACSVSNVHHWPYWNASKAVYRWQHNNHVTFMLGRVDSAVFSGKIFAYAGRFMFQFTNFGNGVATRVKVHSAQADAIPCGVYVSAGADGVSAEFGILDVQGQDLSVWPETLAAVAGLPALLFDATDTRINIASLRTEFQGQGVMRCTSPSGAPTTGCRGLQVRLGMLRASSYNLDGDNAVFNLGTTLTSTNGGYPQNQVWIGIQPFLEDGTGAPVETSGHTGTLTIGGGSSGGGSTDRLSVSGTYVIRADAPSGVQGQGLFRSTMGTYQVLQLVAEGTSPNVDIQLIPKGLGRILDKTGTPITGGPGGGSSGPKLVSPDSTQEAEIKNSGGFFVTDITQSKAARLVADGNIDAGASGQWAHSGTTDLKNYFDKRVNELISGATVGASTRATYLGGTNDVYYSGGVLRVGGASYQNDGNVLGNAFNTAYNGGLGGNGSLTNYIDARASAFSDYELKVNVQPYVGGLDTVRAVQPKSFSYKPEAHLPAGRHTYFIAQEIEEIAPELVKLQQLGDDQYRVLDPKGLIAVLWNAVRELSAKVDALEAKS